MKTVVMSVGGSLINPGQIQIEFLKKLKSFVTKNPHKVIIVCGGGYAARSYITAAKEFGVKPVGWDEIGIKATVLNAELLRHIFKAPPVQQKPVDMKFSKVLVCAGWLPGCSTDYDAVLWAKKFNVKEIFNLSNRDYVYTKDPKFFPDAKPLKKLSWKEYKKTISQKWTAGLSTPFDPVASKSAEKAKMKVICLNGQKLEQLDKYLKGKQFIGTVIG
ncbi:Uridylate kinase [uncultured archaeon]|nr:Uridylate kinase [uncultured archaeon]